MRGVWWSGQISQPDEKRGKGVDNWDMAWDMAWDNESVHNLLTQVGRRNSDYDRQWCKVVMGTVRKGSITCYNVRLNGSGD